MIVAIRITWGEPESTTLRLLVWTASLTPVTVMVDPVTVTVAPVPPDAKNAAYGAVPPVTVKTDVLLTQVLEE